MVNTQLLEDKIKEAGKTKTYLANRIGKTIQALRLKMDNKYDFTSTEVDILCAELGITKLSEKDRIFFAKNVE